MKKNPNKNILTNFPFRTRYYLSHPWEFIRECWHNLQNAWFRMTRGIAPVDLWNFDTYLENIIPYGLRWLADNTHSWPQSDEFPNFEDWQYYLRNLADKWDIAFKDWTDYTEENEYNKEFHALMRSLTVREKTEDGFWRHSINETPEYLALREKYQAREKEIMEKYENLQHECWIELERHFHALWD